MDEKLLLSRLEGLSPRIRTIFRCLEENVTEGPGLRKLARLFRMHSASLSRRWHRELADIGYYLTLSDYRDMLRFRRAKQAFRSDPLLECKKVAALVGTSPRNLRRIFQSFTNSTPEDYRLSCSVTKKC